MILRTVCFLLAAWSIAFLNAAGAAEGLIRVGIIGCDTSHVPAYTKIINEAPVGSELAGLKIVAAFPAGTDIPASRDRVAGFTETLRDSGVQIVDSIDALLPLVDAVLLESVDGRPHLEQA